MIGRTTVAVMLLATAGAAAATVGSPKPTESELATVQEFEGYNAPYDGLYHFMRIYYDTRFGGGRRGFGRGEPPPLHDFPRAERNFLKIVQETTMVPSLVDGSNLVRLDDPELFKHPIAYIVEVGDWHPTESEIENLSDYLLKGGMLIVDDTRDDRRCCPAFDNFAAIMAQVLPGLSLVEVANSDQIFDSFFRIVPQDVIPPYGMRPPTWWGIYEDNDPSERLLVIFNYNNDIAEYWEYSDRGWYSIDLSNEAYKLGVNYVVYGLTR